MSADPSDFPTLDSFDKEEWRDAAKRLDRNYSDEKFDADWDEFVQMKQRRKQ